MTVLNMTLEMKKSRAFNNAQQWRILVNAQKCEPVT